MELAHRWGDRNLTRIELIGALLILAILIGFFGRYTLIMFSRAEQNLVSSTVLNINTAMYYRASMAIMLNKHEGFEKITEINPMEDMQIIPDIGDLNVSAAENQVFLNNGLFSAPINYNGVIFEENEAELERGKWYFNQTEKHLVYVIDNDEFFESNLEGLARIRFRVVFKYEDKNSDGKFDLVGDQFLTIKLSPVDYYQWEQ